MQVGKEMAYKYIYLFFFCFCQPFVQGKRNTCTLVLKVNMKKLCEIIIIIFTLVAILQDKAKMSNICRRQIKELFFESILN